MTTNAEPNAAALFLEFSHQKLVEQYWPRLRTCVESLTDEQVWWRPNDSSNSIGNLMLHLNGNVRQWLVASFNRLEDRRDRPAEFNERHAVIFRRRAAGAAPAQPSTRAAEVLSSPL